ncbi:nuclear transport factor 2 family protein [Sediminibacterium sp.]|uniref:YybH family protein n=1 Tax=Sediminibacterium sp. TaxID=1917865 RepID=UPI00271C0387|nr:nuclear transport factor 2 family protein [Sediminibacterium sp.]MDO9000503.1 nuclear transport factor 2 family protein [Bacteroidota bacterium]MDP3146929.1 nuclear transport factor 2 family protein [Bacteroidota bacterium]MDP3567533.1 nuclear transport factor 2 family protein [Sediminibacterium sp.]
MKKTILFLFILVFFGASAQELKGDLKTVSNIMSAQTLAWNNADINGFMDYYWKSDSLKFIGSKGVTYGWQKTLDNYIKNYPDKEAMGILKFTIIESVQLSKASIYVIGKWELKKDVSAGGHFTLLWKKINNKWVIVSDHTS